MARWISGIILAVAVVLLLLHGPAAWIIGFVLVLAFIGTWEFVGLGSKARVDLRRVAAGILGVLGTYLIFLGALQPERLLFFPLFMALVLGLGFVLQFPGMEAHAQKLACALQFVVGVFYTVVLFGSILMILNSTGGRAWIFFLLGTTFLADTGAYLAGKTLGRRKLAPHLSPGKTIEGLIGGIAAGVLAGVLGRLLFPHLLRWTGEIEKPFPLGIALIAGVILSITGLLGDLSESLLKRAFNAKDSGALIPGHGGLLDRVDGLLINAPLVVLLIYLLR